MANIRKLEEIIESNPLWLEMDFIRKYLQNYLKHPEPFENLEGIGLSLGYAMGRFLRDQSGFREEDFLKGFRSGINVYNARVSHVGVGLDLDENMKLAYVVCDTLADIELFHELEIIGSRKTHHFLMDIQSAIFGFASHQPTFTIAIHGEKNRRLTNYIVKGLQDRLEFQPLTTVAAKAVQKNCYFLVKEQELDEVLRNKFMEYLGEVQTENTSNACLFGFLAIYKRFLQYPDANQSFLNT